MKTASAMCVPRFTCVTGCQRFGIEKLHIIQPRQRRGGDEFFQIGFQTRGGNGFLFHRRFAACKA